jgi:hypothetical protein
VQQLRSRAQAAGNLNSTSQQNVVVNGDGPDRTIVIQPTQPDVVYVPYYNPTVVYGPWLYPAYEPFYWYPPGYAYAGLAFSFGAGLFIGHALWGGYDWRGHSVHINNINYYNSFNHSHITSGRWEHDPSHRGGVGYGNRSVGERYGGGGRFAARESFRGRADAERGNLNRDRSSFNGGGRQGGGNFGGGRQGGGNFGGGGRGEGGRGGGSHMSDTARPAATSRGEVHTGFSGATSRGVPGGGNVSRMGGGGGFHGGGGGGFHGGGGGGFHGGGGGHGGGGHRG